ncbi:dienelactone hydrolase family protein [Actinoplanes sp. NPDC000266]
MRLARVLVAVTLVVAGLVAYAIKQARTPVSLRPDGVYAVGRTTGLWVDRSRTDQFAPLGGTPRLLAVWTWYPATPAPGPESAYAPPGWEGLHRYGPAATSFDSIRTGTRDEVAFAAGPFPVVVLLPDQGAAAPQYTALASRIAAQGYLVVGVTPTYSAGLTVLDGRPVRASAAGRDPTRRTQLVSVLAADARFAAARAVTQYGRHADPAKVVYVGHGLGGTAAAEACQADDRCDGAAALGEEGGLVLGDRAFTVEGAERLTFTDAALYRLAPPVRWALPLGRIDGRRALEITSAYLSAYLGAATRGRAWAAPSYPEVRPAAMLGQ